MFQNFQKFNISKTYLLLMIIILVGALFRTYNLPERFGFAHDADLYSWIVKDIVVDHNLRLIGQETSASGVYIGPLFYYLLIPFFLIFNMDPIGSAYLGLVIGLLTTLSYFYCLSKIFNKTVGLIAAFLNSTLLFTVGFDIWVVPTITTKLWAIWYLYTLLMLSRGNFKVLPLLGLLIGLIWHIHLALIPALLAIPVAIYVSKKIPSKKQILYFILIILITSLPLIIFELRNNFIQIQSIINSFTEKLGGGTGIYKLMVSLEFIAKNTNSLFFFPNSISSTFKFIPVLLISAIGVFLVAKKILKVKEVVIFLTWILGILFYFSLSSKPISEYYFVNIEVIILTVFSLLISYLLSLSQVFKYLVLIFAIFIIANNFQYYVNYTPSSAGYLERKLVTEFIKNDVENKGYPCIGINYITYRGENVGFRYLSYYYNLKLAPPSNNVPVYSIVYPHAWSGKEITKSFGPMGVIVPAKTPPKEIMDYHCSGANINLTEPVLGFVK